MRRGIREKIVRVKKQKAALSSAADELVRSTLAGNPSLPSAAALQAAVDRMKNGIQVFHQ